MIEETVAFARRAHVGTVRKGTNIPYITHPMEAVVTISLMMEDEDLVVAALLHDVIEDTDVTPEELEERFGRRVTELALKETEDESGSWSERKSATVGHLKHATLKSKILTLADKLNSLRSTVRDYMMVGEGTWQRFNEGGRSEHRRYYGSIMKELEELLEYPAYQRYVLLFHKTFGTQIKKGRR